MDAAPRVSVIVTVYNSSRYCADAIESVLSQTYRDFEIIIVDDGSVDDSRKVIEKYGPRVRYFYQKNHGVSVARNRGIREARGALIAYLDGDDIWFPDKLEMQLAYMEKTGFGLIYSDMMLGDESGKPYKRWLSTKKRFGEGWKYIDLLAECFMVPSSVLVKKSILEEVGGFDETLSSVDDLDLWLRVSKRYQIGFVPKPLVIWRQHRQSVSRDIKKNYSNLQKLYRKHLKLVQGDERLEEIIKGRIAEKVFLLNRELFIEKVAKDAKRGLFCYLRSVFSFDNIIYLLSYWVSVKFAMKLLPTVIK